MKPFAETLHAKAQDEGHNVLTLDLLRRKFCKVITSSFFSRCENEGGIAATGEEARREGREEQRERFPCVRSPACPASLAQLAVAYMFFL